MSDNNQTTTMINGHTQARKFKLSYVWKIENFSILGKKKLDCLETPIFSAENSDNVKWQLILYPKGRTHESSDYVSVLIQFHPTEKVKEIEANTSIHVRSKSTKNDASPSSTIFFTNKNPFGVIDKFMKRIDIINNDNILINDCLTLVIDIAYCVDVITSCTLGFDISNFKICNCKLQEGYKSLLDSQELTDIVLVASDKELYAHKAILAAHSPVFLAMFSKDTKEKALDRVDIVDIDYDILQEMLRFLYCGKVENLDTIVNDLLVVADKYDVKVLKEECEKYLCSKLCMDNVVELLSKADMHNALILKQYAINFFVSHKNELVNTDTFDLFGNLQPQTIVEITRKLILQ